MHDAVGSDPLEVLLIGAGFGRQHANWIRETDGLRLKTVGYHANKKAAEELAREHEHCDVTDAPLALIGTGRYDVVSIVSPPATHEAFLSEAMKAGVTVMCEKPLTDSAASAENLFKLYTERQAQVHVTFQWRLHPALIRARSLIRDSDAAEWSDISISFKHNFLTDNDSNWAWRHTGGPGEGALSDLGSHMLDLLRFLFPLDWRVTSASFCIVHETRNIRGADAPCTSDDRCDIDLETAARPLKARIGCNRASDNHPAITIAISGENRKILIDINPDNAAAKFSLDIQGGRPVKDLYTDVSINPYQFILPARGPSIDEPSAHATLEDAYKVQKLIEEAKSLFRNS